MEALREFGLTEYEVAVYKALLALGSSGGGEIARKSNVPHGKTYTTLQGLEEKGLITILPTKPKTFRALSPKEGIGRLAKKRMNALAFAEEAAIKSLTEPAERKPSGVREKLEIYSGFDKQYEIARKMLDETKHSLLIYSEGEKLPWGLYTRIERLVKNGVDYRLIASKLDREALSLFKDAGVSVRLLDVGNFSLVICDGTEVMQVIKSPDDPKDRVTILFREADLAKALTAYFESLWSKAKPVSI